MLTAWLWVPKAPCDSSSAATGQLLRGRTRISSSWTVAQHSQKLKQCTREKPEFKKVKRAVCRKQRPVFQQVFTRVWLEYNLAILYFLKNCFSDPIPQWTNFSSYHRSRKYEKTPLTCAVLPDDTSTAPVSALAKHQSPGRCQTYPQCPTAAGGGEPQPLLPSGTTLLRDPKLDILSWAQLLHADLG